MGETGPLRIKHKQRVINMVNERILIKKNLTFRTLHTETAPAIRAAVKTVVSCQCSRLRFRMLRLKTEETPVFCVCKQKQEFIATDAI